MTFVSVEMIYGHMNWTQVGKVKGKNGSKSSKSLFQKVFHVTYRSLSVEPRPAFDFRGEAVPMPSPGIIKRKATGYCVSVHVNSLKSVGE